jgi:hypothetical protein
MSEKHTPGPWRAVPQPGQTVGVHTFTHCVMAGDDALADTLTEPDARIIAAAPDLLAACKAQAKLIHECLRHVVANGPVLQPGDFVDVIAQAARAMLKAEGGEA